MRDILSKLDAIEQQSNLPEVGDAFGISLSEDFEISTEIVGFTADGIVVSIDEEAQNILESQGVRFHEGYLEEGLRDPKDNPCWKGYKPVGTKKKNGKTVPNCVPKESIEEEKQKGVDGKACWKGYRRQGTKMKGGRRVDNCVKVSEGIENSESISLKNWDGFFGLENTPDGVIVYGEDTEGGFYDQEGEPQEFGVYFDFIYNLTTDKIIEIDSNDTAGEYDQYYRDEDTQEEIIRSIVDDIKKEYGSTWEEISDQLYTEVDKEDINLEAEYQGKDVPLGKKLPGDVKKYKVYVKNPQGNVVKVNFGDKKMRIKKSNPNRRKSFRARHNCDNPGPRHKARYWSCRNW